MSKKKVRSRPIKVLYYRDAKSMPHEWDRVGHCKAEVGVLRGAVIRLFLREYALARVYKEGICILTVKLRDDGLPEVRFGPHSLGIVSHDGSIKPARSA